MTSLDRRRAPELIRALTGQRVLIAGDVMLDQFVVGRVDRISPEAPVPVVQFDHDEYRLGGAANVAHNVRSLGGEITLVGVVGADAAADRLREELGAHGIACGGLIADPHRQTTRKLRIVTDRRHQVARVDYEDDAEIAEEVEARLCERLAEAAAGASVIVVSDYLKGVVTRNVMACVIEAARRHGTPVLVDPKIPHIDYYAGASIITPNHHEAEVATHMRIRTTADARAAAREFRRRTDCASVLVTRGEHGMWLLEGMRADGSRPGDGEILLEEELPAAAREVSDVTGAGDTVIATMALGLAAGARLGEAARLANHAAGIAVGRFGPATVTQAELLGAID